MSACEAEICSRVECGRGIDLAVPGGLVSHLFHEWIV